MPSVRSQKMLRLIRSHKRAALYIGKSWIMRLSPNARSVAKLRLVGTKGEVMKDAGVQAVMIRPPKADRQDAVILHLHGGAFVSGGILQSRAIASPICAAARIATMTFSYRLAPQAPYPAQLEDALTAYRFLLSRGYTADRIALTGESAGGNLALALTARLRDRGEPLPAAIALMSPWVDLAQTGASYRELADVDATLDAQELMKNAVAFAGGPDRLRSPDISPVYGDFTDFPPVQIHCGTHEILLSDAEKLEAALRRDGVQALLVRWAGMCHVFQAFGFEESKASIRQIGAFLRGALCR